MGEVEILRYGDGEIGALGDAKDGLYLLCVLKDGRGGIRRDARHVVAGAADSRGRDIGSILQHAEK